MAVWAFAGAVTTATLVSAPASARADMREDIKDGDDAYSDGNWKKAIAAYDRAIRNYPKQVAAAVYSKRASIYLIQATDARRNKNEDLAKSILEDGLKFIIQRAEATYPSAPEVLEQKALILWELKSKPDAIKVAEVVVKEKPDAFAVQRILGEFYAVREPERAIKALKTYLAERPESLEKGDVLPRLHLGFAYMSRAKATRRQDPAGSTKLAENAVGQFELLLQRHRKRQHAEVNANNGLCSAYTFIGKYDQAITVCEQIIQNPRNIDRAGSVFYNLGQSYLQNRQASKARTMGREFVRIRKTEPRGYLMVGDSFAQEGQWKQALEEYLKAEEYAKNKSDVAAEIGVAMGIAYRRDNNLPLAISKLEAAIELDPDSPRLIVELGNAYLASGQDDKALARTEAAINANSFAAQDKAMQVDLLRVAGAAAYNLANVQGEKKALDPEQARKHFEAASALNRKNVAVRIGLVRTINLQAYRAYTGKDAKKAEVYLGEALEVNKREPMSNQNLAVLRIEAGDCDGARQRLAALSKARNYALTYNRLMARTYLCQKKADKVKAAEHFARAEKAAGNANLVRAEIYTEWAPLLWDKDLDRAVEMLESAVQFTAQNPTLAKSANRNLALALFRRGWRDMRSRKAASAADDFARASRDPRVLKGTEPEAFEFSEALAQLERGDSATASKLFAKLAKGGKQGAYLKAPYDKVGAQFFGAYAKYRSGNAAQQRQAASEFQGMLGGAKGAFGSNVRELLAAAYEEMAASSYSAGKASQAASELASADKYASGASKRNIEHNRAVAQMGTKYSKAIEETFDRMGTSPAEALANKGVMLDRAGKPKEAYDAWVQAKAKGARDRELSNWISAKKRIFGY
ncbi:MAG TPA: tetratricopeptide repeat protein [Kofleriaceae bacterium]|nr:tetratricopeptide repeat protein [Kofleriaceae bacterium]